MHHRSGSWVKGHYRNGTWIAGHSRKSAYVSDYTKNSYSGYSFKRHNLQKNTYVSDYTKNNYSNYFTKDIIYENIDSEIKKAIFNHLLHLKIKKLENKNNSDFISYLESYIIDNLESNLLEIKNIRNFYIKLKDIVQIVHLIILCEINPSYKIIYNLNKEGKTTPDTSEDGKNIMKNIILENRAILSQYYNQDNWEYQRNTFFDQEVKYKIYNPGINFRLLFKKICEENFIKGEIIILNKEEIIEVMKNIIKENRVVLSQYYNQNDWEYQRNKFFDQKVKSKIYNPKLALHILFKKVCDDNLK